VAAYPVTVAKPSLNAPSSSVLRQHQKERQSADSTEGHLQALEQNEADSVAQRLRPSMALKRAKREPNGHWACVGFGS